MTLVATARAQTCVRPIAPGSGLAVALPVTRSVVYSDGYVTDGRMLLPNAPPPVCGWPLVVYVHRLGANPLENLPLQQTLVAQGHAVWSYGVRGQASGLHLYPGNDALPGRGSTLWGPRERHDLGEQIAAVAADPLWAGAVDPTRVAVVGFSQGSAHAWAAAALSGQTLSLAQRTPVQLPHFRCVVAIDYVADTVRDWLRDETMWSMWFVNNITADIDHRSLGFLLDQGLWDSAKLAFEQQDPAALLAQWNADGRDIVAQLRQSTVPILHSQAYHDLINSPLPSLELLSASPAPRKVFLSTLGHDTPNNDGEERLLLQLVVRWLHRFLWDEPNDVDLEAPVVMAELPLDPAERQDRSFLWGHSHGPDPLAAVGTSRFYLEHTGNLQSQQPAVGQAPVLIDHQVQDPSFTPQGFLAELGNRSLPSVLAASPLSEVVFVTAPLANEQVLRCPARVRLAVTPEQADWMVSALLQVELPSSGSGGAQRVMLSSRGVRRTQSTPGVSEVVDVVLPPVHTRLPAGSRVVLTLRNHWLREGPMDRRLEVAPVFHPFRISVHCDATLGGSYCDLPLENPKPALVADRIELDLATMHPVAFELRGGQARAGKSYFISLSATGQAPGTLFLNDILPMNLDFVTAFVVTNANSAQLQGFFGDLETPGGRASAVLDLSALAPFSPALAGLRLTAAGFVWDVLGGPTGAASNPVDVILR